LRSCLLTCTCFSVPTLRALLFQPSFSSPSRCAFRLSQVLVILMGIASHCCYRPISQYFGS
jgi:hypothetical protein